MPRSTAGAGEFVRIYHVVKFRKIPPVFALADITTADTTQALVFHAGGDSGGSQLQVQEQLAHAMAADVPGGEDPAFLPHLGDVMYGANKDNEYVDRLYRAYSSYPYPIVAVPGNHDGEVRSGTDPTTLRAFSSNFCAATAAVPGAVAQIGITRKTMTQPGVYWLMTTPLADIIGLYTNSGENGGTLEDGHGSQDQIKFLNTVLSEIATQRAAGTRKALVVATHHPPFSNGGHAGSPVMLGQIDKACVAAGVYPDVIVSGHAHSDQIYSRKFDFGASVIRRPYYVSGTLGVALQSVVKPTGTVSTGTLNGAITCQLGEEAYGDLIIRITASDITVTVRSMSKDGTVVSDLDTRTYPLSQGNRHTMSHFNQQYIEPLQRIVAAENGQLPKGVYLSVTGEFDHISPISSATGRPDERHVFAWINVTTGKYDGKYEAAINVHSNRPDSTVADPEEVKYHLAVVSVAESEWPPVRVNTDAALSFAGLGLHESDFTLDDEDGLHHVVQEYASNCDRISVFGMSYSNGAGFHDVHLNDGMHKDGAVGFYYGTANGGPLVRWLFLKFQQPVLP